MILPAFPCLYGTLDELAGHYRRYDRKEVAGLVGDLEVEIQKYHYFNALGAVGWFVKGRIFKQKFHTDSNFNWMNKLLPMISAVERYLKPRFGISIVLVLKKRSS